MAIIQGFPPSNQINLGLGQIGGNVTFTRKFRWTFTGYNSRGKELFNSFVKLTKRPDPDSRLNTIQFIQHCVMYDTKEEAQKDIDNAKFAMPRIEYGHLTLWDRCGCELERWEFDCVEAKITQFDEVMDGADITTEVKFESVVYVPSIAFPPPK